MSDILVKNGIRPPVPVETSGSGAAGAPGAADKADSFSTVLKGKIREINELQQEADKAITGVMLDDSRSIHEAVIALEKANVSFRTMMEVRNKIIEAYQEVMRMQV